MYPSHTGKSLRESMGWRHGAVVTVAVEEHEQESVMHRRKSGPSAPLVQWLGRGERHWEDAQRGEVAS